MLLLFKTDSRLTSKDVKLEFTIESFPRPVLTRKCSFLDFYSEKMNFQNHKSVPKKVEREKIQLCLSSIVAPLIQTLVWQNMNQLTSVPLLLESNALCKINWLEKIFTATCTIDRFVRIKIGCWRQKKRYVGDKRKELWLFWILDLSTRWNRSV